MPALSLVSPDPAAAAHVRPAPAPGPSVMGIHSLREMGDQAVAEAESNAICRALASAKGNKSMAARLLQTNYTTLHAKMRRFGISAQEFRLS
jgi:DNA-binding NtrC family response regulator